MKRILLLLLAFVSLTACSQNQTFTGIKTFNSPPKFKNLQNNEANTKVLTVNSNDVLQWKSAGSFTSPIPNLNQVTENGNFSEAPIRIDFQNGLGCTLSNNGLSVDNNANGSAFFNPNQITINDFYNNINLDYSNGLQGITDTGTAFGIKYGEILLKNSTYPNRIIIDNPIQNNDLYFKLPVKSNGLFEIGTKEDIDLVKRPYKVYTALLNQSATNNPVATVLENTLGDIIFTRDDIGEYIISNINNLFVANKTFFIYNSTSGFRVSIGLSNTNTAYMSVQEPLTGDSYNGYIGNDSIEIRVYN